jgi:hypothetical protein
MSKEGDTAQCVNCPHQIEYRRYHGLQDAVPTWVHVIPRSWPEKDSKMYLINCPHPYNPPMATPKEQSHAQSG